VPLVVVLDGGFWTGAQTEHTYGWDSGTANAGSFVDAYPDGIDRSWNAEGCYGRAERNGVIGVGFEVLLIEVVAADEHIDWGRFHLSGISVRPAWPITLPASGV
jgi:polyhydroxybutyrate depolymerase